jgi:hypothetical protein
MALSHELRLVTALSGSQMFNNEIRPPRSVQSGSRVRATGTPNWGRAETRNLAVVGKGFARDLELWQSTRMIQVRLIA